jgi:hypothetical protein
LAAPGRLSADARPHRRTSQGGSQGLRHQALRRAGQPHGSNCLPEGGTGSISLYGVRTGFRPRTTRRTKDYFLGMQKSRFYAVRPTSAVRRSSRYPR